MRVTICELPEERSAFDREWERMVRHVRVSGSEVVLLPDIALEQWSARLRRPNDQALAAPALAFDAWHRHLSPLASALVLGSHTVDFGNERYDEGFVWDAEHGMRSVHAKLHTAAGQGHLADASADFIPMEVRGLRICFLLGAELLLEDEARRYGYAGVDLLATRRRAPQPSFDEWLAQARKDAVLARAHVLASHRSGKVDGHGFVVAPSGKVLGATEYPHSCLSFDLDVNPQSPAIFPLSLEGEGRVRGEPTAVTFP
jgi:N-carbamoylputrescine amidase